MGPQTHSIRLHDSESVGGSLGPAGTGMAASFHRKRVTVHASLSN
jgi:hypothetical protein